MDLFTPSGSLEKDSSPENDQPRQESPAETASLQFIPSDACLPSRFSFDDNTLMGNIKPEQFYSSSYFEAREAFLAAARNYGAEIFSHIPPSLQDHDPELTIDVALFGPENASKVIVHMSGAHGVEGYTGSAIQQLILNSDFELPEDTRVVFIHALNPYGMAYNRRVNESNVDLNRNCFREESARKGSPPFYDIIDPIINPQSAPGWFNLFLVQAAFSILKHGFQPLKQAVAGGQYEYPKGLYFGGTKTEDSVKFLEEFFLTRLSEARDIFVIDIHSGLGDYAGEIMMVDAVAPADLPEVCRDYLSTEPFYATPAGIAYQTSGQISEGICELLESQNVYWFTQEFGTYHPVRVASALREENRYHHFGEGNPEHYTKRRLVDVFNPPDPVWREKVLLRGLEVFNGALRCAEERQVQSSDGTLNEEINDL